MTTPDLKKLKELATDVNLKTVRWYSENHTDNLLIGLLDRRFIAAANPQTILAMIERIEKLEKVVRSAQAVQDQVKIMSEFTRKQIPLSSDVRDLFKDLDELEAGE